MIGEAKMTPVGNLARKYRRALRNNTGMSLTIDQVQALTDAGALELVTTAENEEMKEWAVIRHRTSSETIGSTSGEMGSRERGKSPTTIPPLDRSAIAALSAGI